MNKYRQQTELKCNIVTSPTSSPVRFQQLSRRPSITDRPLPATSKFISSGNVKEIFRRGAELLDLILGCRNITKEDRDFLKETQLRGDNTYIYSSVPGSPLQACPLTRGAGGDPEDGIYTATVASGTTIFLPRGDTARTAYLEETDFADHPILANGIQNHSGAANTLSNELPLGRGVVIPSIAKNYIKNSGLDDDGTDIYNWTLTGAGAIGGALRRNENGWMGVPSLQLWGTNEWTADSIDGIPVRGKEIAISFGWRTDGEIELEVDFNNGIGFQSEVVLAKGAGYYRGSITVDGTANNIDLKWSVKSGTLSEFCAPQVTLISGADMKYYSVYMEGLGNNIRGEITACSLKYTGEYEAGAWVMSPGNDSTLIVSGFVQPMIKASQMEVNHKLFSLHHSLTNKELECHITEAAGKLKIYLRSNAVALCNVEVTEYAHGDVLFIAMAVGWEFDVYTHGIYARVVDGTTTYSAKQTGTANFYTIYNELLIGTDHNGLIGADAIFQDVNIWNGCYTPCCPVTSQVEYMTDLRNLMEHSETLGRLYHLIPQLSPSPWNRDRFSGSIYCENVEAI